MNIVTEELVGEHRLKKRLRNQCFDLIIRETNGKIVPHILPFFERISKVSWLNTVYSKNGLRHDFCHSPYS